MSGSAERTEGDNDRITTKQYEQYTEAKRVITRNTFSGNSVNADMRFPRHDTYNDMR